MESSLKPPAIEPADLIWRDGVPESVRFSDVYFSRDNGLEETRHVFIGHNNLPERFAAVPAGGSFVIAESGFGTGLNFLAAWQAWQRYRPVHEATLHFVSVERFPLTRTDLAKALALWPELASLADALLADYPPLVRGTHRLVLDGGRVRLTLFFGDIRDAWQALEFKADAWFLDGFAPARNPDMWLETTVADIRAHSKPGTSLATFTSVGRVRRALSEAGFEVQKVPGFGRKREMLRGVLPPVDSLQAPDLSPVAIIGAGIAGCTLAANLVARGIPVTLIDEEAPGAGASGNAQGALYVKLGVDYNDQTELALNALTFSQRFYRPFSNEGWYPTGLLQLAHNNQEADRQHRFLERNVYPGDVLSGVNREQASELTGIPVDTGGLWFPGSGWLEPARLCRALAERRDVTGVWHSPVEKLAPEAEGWRIEIKGASPVYARRVVVCGGAASGGLLPLAGTVRLKSIRGQVTGLPATGLTPPRAVICGSRYLNPALDNRVLTGATFDLHDDNPTPTLESRAENIQELKAMLPGAFPDGGSGQAKHAEQSQSDNLANDRVAFRCTTHDYQPVAGHLRDGLYLFTGLGSKGLTYAPLLAEYLADQLTGQPGCLPANLVRRLETGRLYQSDMAIS